MMCVRHARLATGSLLAVRASNFAPQATATAVPCVPWLAAVRCVAWLVR
jgi:hypothetical protein